MLVLFQLPSIVDSTQSEHIYRQTKNTFIKNTRTSKLLILIISKTHQDYCIPHEYCRNQRPSEITLSSAIC